MLHRVHRPHHRRRRPPLHPPPCRERRLPRHVGGGPCRSVTLVGALTARDHRPPAWEGSPVYCLARSARATERQGTATSHQRFDVRSGAGQATSTTVRRQGPFPRRFPARGPVRPAGVLGPRGRIRGADVRDSGHAPWTPSPVARKRRTGLRPHVTASRMRAWFPSVLRTASTRFEHWPTGVGGLEIG